MPNIIVRLVLAQVGKIDPVTVEQGAIIALKETIQASNDGPVKPP
jgi:hypothetical protein